MERLLHQYFRVLVRYNAWANSRLYARCGALDENAYRNGPAASGRSVHELLTARLASDRLWLARLAGYADYELAVGAPSYASLDELREAHLAQDVELFEYVDALAEEDLLRPTRYETGEHEAHTNAQYELLTHLFAEQVADRGRIADCLRPAPDLDVLTFLRDAEAGRRPLHP